MRSRSALLIMLIAMILVMAECVARFIFPRVSQMDRRMTEEVRAAAIVGTQLSPEPAVLLLGNCLLEDSVKMDVLQSALPQPWRAHRVLIEDAFYIEWLEGVRGLLKGGARPKLITLMLSPQQLVSNAMRGPYVAYHLLGAKESMSAGLRARYGLTDLSGLLIGHFSAAYGLRAELRSNAFGRVVPQAEELAQIFSRGASLMPALSAARLSELGHARLLEFKEMCAQFGVACAYMTPPYQGHDPRVKEAVQMADKLGMRAEQWYYPDTFFPKDFKADGYHMNSIGASAYTDKVAKVLQQIIIESHGQ
jgi:hypothetical protein